MITIIKNIFKSGGFARILIVLFVALNLAFFVYQKYQISNLSDKNAILQAEKEKNEREIQNLNLQVLDNKRTIDELGENIKDKEILSKELNALRRELYLKGKDDNESINEYLRFSVDFVLDGLREQKSRD